MSLSKYLHWRWGTNACRKSIAFPYPLPHHMSSFRCWERCWGKQRLETVWDLFSWILLLIVHYWYIGKQNISLINLVSCNWLNSFISFWVRFQGFLHIVSCHSSESFTSSHPICMPFISCLMNMARTSNTVLNRSGESWHPYLIPEFTGKTFSFSCWIY